MAYDAEAAATKFPVLHYDPKASIGWTLSPLLKTFLILIGISCLLANAAFFRLAILLNGRRQPRPKNPNPPTFFSPASPSVPRPPEPPTHLLVVLGSGGHTAEMLNMLQRLPLRRSMRTQFTHRTYVVSSGDGFSAAKAAEFEAQIVSNAAPPPPPPPSGKETGSKGDGIGKIHADYDVVTVRRARKIHQSILTTPWTATLCLWDCLKVLRQTHPEQQQQQQQGGTTMNKTQIGYPDLIMTNGPGTGVCVIFAALILLFFGIHGGSRPLQQQQQQNFTPIGTDTSSSSSSAKPNPNPKTSGQMRMVFIESWARVKTLSLSGKILLPFVDRFLVQWPALQGYGGKAEYVGSLVA